MSSSPERSSCPSEARQSSRNQAPGPAPAVAPHHTPRAPLSQGGPSPRPSAATSRSCPALGARLSPRPRGALQGTKPRAEVRPLAAAGIFTSASAGRGWRQGGREGGRAERRSPRRARARQDEPRGSPARCRGVWGALPRPRPGGNRPPPSWAPRRGEGIAATAAAPPLT